MARVHTEKDRIRDRIRYDYGQSVLKRYKLMKGCANCGYNENEHALQFNHIDPKQKRFLLAQKAHKMVLNRDTKGKQKLKEELNKCEVVCANCHAIITYENKHYAVHKKDR
tara:strand:+ start:1019 stop:1351 length:333 start_codon:yes stop_codon:yes gene_type:complete